MLQEIKTLLETSSTEDWWNELSEADQHLLLESEAHYEWKEFTSHFWQHSLKDCWPPEVLTRFEQALP